MNSTWSAPAGPACAAGVISMAKLAFLKPSPRNSCAILSASVLLIFRRAAGELAGRLVQCLPRLFLALGELGQEFTAILERGQLRGRLLAKRDHALDRSAVLAFQALHEIEPVLELAQLFRVEIDPLRAGLHGVEQFGELGDGRAVERLHVGDRRVHALPGVERPLDLRELRHHRRVRFTEQADDGARLFDDVLRVRGRAVIVVELRVLARLELRRADLAGLVLEQREPLLAFRLAHFERFLFGDDLAQFAMGGSARRPQRGELAVGIEQLRLLLVREQRLVIVRPRVRQPAGRRALSAPEAARASR